jgi:hypothetical protein
MIFTHLVQNLTSENFQLSRSRETPYRALLRVVDRHEPQEITLPNGEWGLNCKTCDGYSYPCITIVTIIEELS